MPRPLTPIGSWGNIRAKELPSKIWQAEAQIRIADGTTRRVQSRDTTKTKSINTLKVKLGKMADDIMAGDISPETRIKEVAKLYLAELDKEYRLSGRSPDTVRQYRSYVRNWVNRSVGDLTCLEMQQPKRANDLIQRCRSKKSYEAASSLRSVLNGICEFAIRHGAMKTNPIKSTQRLVRGTPKKIKSLTLPQRVDLIAKLKVFGEKKQKDSLGRSLGDRGRIWLQLADLVVCMLATGVRVGELLALTGTDVNIVNVKVHFAYHLVPSEGEGVIRMPLRKGNEGVLILAVPEWSIPTWRRLKLAAGEGPLFPSFSGTWLAPSTMIHRIREAFDACGYEWVTSHVFRKTVTLVLDEADLPTNQIADQLGNTPAVVEKHYRAPRTANTATVGTLETMLTLTEDAI